MPAPITIAVSPDQLNILVAAMHGKLGETEHYLLSSRVGEPDEADLCCDTHRMRYEHRKEMSDAMEARELSERELLDMLTSTLQEGE